MAVVVVVAAAPPPSWAQLPPTSRPPRPKRPPREDDGETHIRADSQERVAKGHYHFQGFVELAAGDLHVQADEVDLYEDELPNGKIRRRVEAKGNVVFMREEERLSGTSATLDLDTGHGTLLSARGFIDPGVFVEADSIERLSAKVYRI